MYHIYNTYNPYTYCLHKHYVIFVCTQNHVGALGAKSSYFLASSLVISNLRSCTDNPRTDNRECTLYYANWSRSSAVHNDFPRSLTATWRMREFWRLEWYREPCNLVLIWYVVIVLKNMQHGGRAKIRLSSCPKALTTELLVLDMGIR